MPVDRATLQANSPIRVALRRSAERRERARRRAADTITWDRRPPAWRAPPRDARRRPPAEGAERRAPSGPS
ncbi:hypothetical protein NBH00_03805 [Paraconexibacter antarcticus]|uniref:Uncharacterized protein n=1 Tax=Paraconexibacter antarcticus TaxID=2949664 RepID=A0ABY5DW74_9ACTN|nr:hypothetical protein [Paraconexibacter antarcticus]UTI65341.1 hypothetical protein NBH00_03805 [Paraconexibacter antarcticus]